MQNVDALRAHEIEQALFLMAKGEYVAEETKITMDAKQQESKVIIRKKLPPDLPTAKFLLQVVDPERFGGADRAKVTEMPAVDPFVEALGRSVADIFDDADGGDDD